MGSICVCINLFGALVCASLLRLQQLSSKVSSETASGTCSSLVWCLAYDTPLFGVESTVKDGDVSL